MVIKDGRFGPYVTDGETNASLRKGDEVASITVERGAELLADRRAAPPTTRRRTTPRPDRRPRQPGRPPAKSQQVGEPEEARPAARILIFRPAADSILAAELKSRSRTNQLCGHQCRYAYAVNFRAGENERGADRGHLGRGAARRQPCPRTRRPVDQAVPAAVDRAVAVQPRRLAQHRRAHRAGARRWPPAARPPRARPSAPYGWPPCCPRCCSARWPARWPTGWTAGR